MNTKITFLLTGILIAGSIIFSLVVGPTMPDIVPVHWDAYGKVNGWGSKNVSLWVGPGILVFFSILLTVLPKISPKDFKIEPFQETYNQMIFIVALLMTFLHIIIVQSSRDPHLNLSKFMIAGMMFFFALIGNLLGKVRRNFWMGIRTPWTLANETVWNTTHRKGGRWMFYGGLIGTVGALLGVPMIANIIFILILSLSPIVYSYVLYRQLEPDSSPDAS